MTKKLAKSGLAVMTTLLVLVIFWQFRIVLVYLLISLTLAATLRPFLKHLIGRSIIVRVAWIFLYLLILGSFGALLFLTGKSVANEIQQLVSSVLVHDQWQMPIWWQGSSFQLGLVARMPLPSKIFEAITMRRRTMRRRASTAAA
jgi:predicted PurR-regulated permease PerM